MQHQLTSTGQPFWSGSKRAPVALVFDASDPLHLAYIKAGANLRASNYGIKGTWDDAYFLAFLPNVVVPDFTPKDGVKIKVTHSLTRCLRSSDQSIERSSDQSVERLSD